MRKPLTIRLSLVIAAIVLTCVGLATAMGPAGASTSSGRTPTATSTTAAVPDASTKSATPAKAATNTGTPTYTVTPAPPVVFTPLTYPGIDKTIPMTHHWACNEPAGSKVCHDSVGHMDLTVMSKYAPDCTMTGAYVIMADHCLFYNNNVDATTGKAIMDFGTDDFIACGTMITRDGHYNWIQVSTTHPPPWGMFKLGTHDFQVVGTLDIAKTFSGLTVSDGIKHYVCGQREGDTFYMIMDGHVMGTKVKVIGNVSFDPATGPHGFMYGGKWDPNQPLSITDMFNGKTWNIQIGQAPHGQH